MEINAFFWIATIKRAQIFVGDVDCKLNEHISSNMFASLLVPNDFQPFDDFCARALASFSKSETEKMPQKQMLICPHLLHASKRPSMIKLEWEIMHSS